MKVCVYVCPAACRWTRTSYHPKIWRGLPILPGLRTKPGGDPKCRPRPRSCPWPHPLLLLSSLDQSARGLFHNCIVKQSRAALGSSRLQSIKYNIIIYFNWVYFLGPWLALLSSWTESFGDINNKLRWDALSEKLQPKNNAKFRK